MRIDPKYFNVFLAVVAAVAAILIALYTYANLRGDERIFKERMMASDSLSTVAWPLVEKEDSLRIRNFNDRYVVLDFWTERSGASVVSQEKLSEVKEEYGDRLTVIAAGVGQPVQDVLTYIREHDYPFIFVEGSHHFSAFDVPAIPAQLVYEPGGSVHSIFIGFRDSAQYDSLRSILDRKSE